MKSRELSRIQNALDSRRIKYRIIDGADPSKETIVVSYSGENFDEINIMFFDNDSQISMKVFTIMEVPENNCANAFMAVNTLNQEYRYLKFTFDQDDRDINVAYDFLPSCNASESIIELIARTVRIIDNAYPTLKESLGIIAPEAKTKSVNTFTENGRITESDSIQNPLEMIEDLCEDFIYDHERTKFTPNSKLITGLGIPANAQVFLGHDDTILRSGKNGFAITSEGVFCKEFLEVTDHTTWKQLSKARDIYWKDTCMYAGNNRVVYYSTATKQEKNDLIDLFEKLQIIAKNMY